jgi:hypothetical protein
MKTYLHFYYISLISAWNEKFFKCCRENQNKQFNFNDTVFEDHAIYDITLKNTVQSGRPQMTIWRMSFAGWLPKATNTHSEHVILIAFPQQQQLHKRATMLRLSVHCLSC